MFYICIKNVLISSNIVAHSCFSRGKLYIINRFVLCKGGNLGLVVAGKCETDSKVIKNGTKTYPGTNTKINYDAGAETGYHGSNLPALELTNYIQQQLEENPVWSCRKD